MSYFVSFVLSFLLLKFYFMNKINLSINVGQEERDSFSENAKTIAAVLIIMIIIILMVITVIYNCNLSAVVKVSIQFRFIKISNKRNC